MTANTILEFRLAPIAAALLTVFGTAHAADGDLMSKITSDSTIEVGVGHVDRNNGNFGKYNGLNEEGANLLALQTRQQLSTTALSLSAQADQAVLRLFVHEAGVTHAARQHAAEPQLRRGAGVGLVEQLQRAHERGRGLAQGLQHLAAIDQPLVGVEH